MDKHYEDVSARLQYAKAKTLRLADLQWDRYAYQFVLCKFVRWLECFAFLKKAPTLEYRVDWRVGPPEPKRRRLRNKTPEPQ